RDAEVVEVFSSRRSPDSPLSHCLSLRWFRSHVVVLGVGPQLGQAVVLRAFVCFRGGSISPFRGGEAGARLVSGGHGRRVPLLAASGGGLVAVITHASGVFRSVFSLFRSPILGCQSVVAPACMDSRPCGVSGVQGGSACRPSTLWRSEVAVLGVRRHSHLVVAWSLRALFARLTPLLPSARGSSSRELGVGRVAEATVVPCVVSNSESECCELLYPSELRVVLYSFSGSVGGDANLRVPGGGPGGRVVTVISELVSTEICKEVYGFPASFVCALQCVTVVAASRAWRVWSLGVFVPWWRGWRWTRWQWSSPYGGRLQASLGTVLFVVFGAFGCVCAVVAERAYVWRGLHRCRGFSQDCSVLVSAVAVLPQGLRCVVGLDGAFCRNGALVVLVEVLPGLACVASACYSVLSDGPCCLVVWVVHSGEGSSQDRPLSLLEEVLPRSALCSFRAIIVLPMWFKVRHLVGLCSGEVLLGRLSALLVEVLPKAALTSCVPVGRVVCFVSRALRALTYGGLVSVVGVWLAVLLIEVSVVRCGFLSRVWKRLVA
ncbi:hypothetical protein Taro_047574, partial [Colocasia esculenta]|nr:hypothetical protein [Colocasia esculenta]